MCQNAGLPEAVNIPTRACARRNSHLCMFADILDPPRAHLGCIRVRALAEPMTARQFGQLATLALCNSVHIPFIEREDRNGQHVTKAEAGRLIIMFENGERPSEEYLDSLGRGPPYQPLSHPLTWASCDYEMTELQYRWLEDLALRLSVPGTVAQKYLAVLTRGQASQMITALRAAEEKHRETQTGELCGEAWFVSMVEWVKWEVPVAWSVSK